MVTWGARRAPDAAATPGTLAPMPASMASVVRTEMRAREIGDMRNAPRNDGQGPADSTEGSEMTSMGNGAHLLGEFRPRRLTGAASRGSAHRDRDLWRIPLRHVGDVPHPSVERILPAARIADELSRGARRSQ